MMFGGEEKMRSARNKVLESALAKIDTNGEFGDLYGQQEAATRRAAMQAQIQASLDYSDNYAHLSPL
jgi:hypothetical protein